MNWLLILVVTTVVYLFFIHGHKRKMKNLQTKVNKLVKNYCFDLKDFGIDIMDEKIVMPKSWDFTHIKGDRKRERITREIVETLFQKPFPSVRPSWLVNPETGRCLEIDCYNEELQLGIEVSGSQHYQQEDHFHKGDRDQFLKQVYRDRIKKEMISAQGIDLIVVPYTIRTDDLPSYIYEKLQTLGRV